MLVQRKKLGSKTHCLHGHLRTPENLYRGGCKACIHLQNRAKKRGWDFTIKITDLLPPPSHCPALGIALDYGVTGIHRDESPSVDRRDSSKGYIPGNVQIISYRANRIKSNASTKELYDVAAWSAGSVWP